MYLFVVSICVIIVHRIISSFAIYRLTKNKGFMLYQLFDLLMIRCVWTNYQLGTNEPSNQQRYLQILEAIFEVTCTVQTIDLMVDIHGNNFIMNYISYSLRL
eukprot:231635_1